MFMIQERGSVSEMEFQVAEVHKGFHFVANLVDQGYKVIFGSKQLCIESSDWNIIRFRRYRGMWYCDCWKFPFECVTDSDKLAQFV